MRTFAAAAALAFWAASPAAAQDSQTLSIQGGVSHPRTLTLDELKALPRATVETDFQYSGGARHAMFAGAALWPLLSEAGMVDEPGDKTFFRHVVTARATDGYAVSLAIGEMDPNGEGKDVIVAYEQDGKPTKSLRLVVPGDRHAARSVHDLSAIEVR